MKITILTYGSRGDVQPFVALALGLRVAGQSVRLAGPRRLADLLDPYGIPFAPLPGDPEEISAFANDLRHDVFGAVKSAAGYVFSIAAPVLRAALAACDDADVIVHSFFFTTAANSLARTRQRALILTGWAGRGPAEHNDDVSCLDAVPHDWLFPRCKSVIHHGGAGTTAAVLRAGIPGIVLPHAIDQMF